MWQNWAHCVYSVFPLLRIIDEFWCNARSLLRLPFHQFDSPIINRRQLRRRCAACFFLFHSFQLSSSPYTLNRMAKVVWSGRASNRRMVQGPVYGLVMWLARDAKMHRWRESESGRTKTIAQLFFRVYESRANFNIPTERFELWNLNGKWRIACANNLSTTKKQCSRLSNTTKTELELQ